MLEHLGGYGIDADALAHRAIAKGAPGYPLVLRAFGEWALDEEGQIDRQKLAKIAFSDPMALERLEVIVHPLVAQAIDLSSFSNQIWQLDAIRSGLLMRRLNYKSPA
jgi:dephospho-CoA kinase